VSKNPWKKYKNYWRKSIVISVLFPLLCILLWRFAFGFKYLLIIPLLALFYLFYNICSALNFRCPNCARSFFFKLGTIGSGKNCTHCGFQKWTLPEISCAKIASHFFWAKVTNLVVTAIFLSPLLVPVIIIRLWTPQYAVHKVLPYNNYSILFVSRPKDVTGIMWTRELTAEIWLDGKKTTIYDLCEMDALDEFDMRIKDISILPDTNQIRVDFDSPERSKSRFSVALYEIK